MTRTKGLTSESKSVKSDPNRQPIVGTHGYTPEETEAAFFLAMEKRKEKHPGLKLSDAVTYWNGLASREKNEYRGKARELFHDRSSSSNDIKDASLDVHDGGDVSDETGGVGDVEVVLGKRGRDSDDASLSDHHNHEGNTTTKG